MQARPPAPCKAVPKGCCVFWKTRSQRTDCPSEVTQCQPLPAGLGIPRLQLWKPELSGARGEGGAAFATFGHVPRRPRLGPSSVPATEAGPPVKAAGTCWVLAQHHPRAGPPPHLGRFWRRGPGCLRRPSALPSKGESSGIQTAPTVVKQQQRKKDGHPLLLDPPVPHGKLPERVTKQALESRPGLGHGHGLGSRLAQYRRKPAHRRASCQP